MEAVWPQLKEWYTGEGNHEFGGRKIQIWRGIMVTVLGQLLLKQ
jgi:hypothetical protein